MATVFNLGKGRGAATVLDPSGAVLTYLQGLPVNATAGSHVAGVGSQFVIENVGTRWLISPGAAEHVKTLLYGNGQE